MDHRHRLFDPGLVVAEAALNLPRRIYFSKSTLPNLLNNADPLLRCLQGLSLDVFQQGLGVDESGIGLVRDVFQGGIEISPGGHEVVHCDGVGVVRLDGLVAQKTVRVCFGG